MKSKKYTIEELKNKYWEFKRIQAIRIESSGSGYGNGCSRTYLAYSNTIEGFLLWLEESLAHH